MSLAQLLNQTCSIIRRSDSGTTNRYGDPLPALTSTTTVCELQQRQRSEDDTAGEVGNSSWLLVLPAGTNIDLGDAVLVDGATFEVQGEPWEARNPRTRTISHIEATVARTKGSQDGS